MQFTLCYTPRESFFLYFYAWKDNCSCCNYRFAFEHGGVKNPCYRSIVSNTDTFEIRITDGEELLIHIGIDTVKLNGKFFKSCVKQEQPVKKGNFIEKMYNES